MAFLFPSKIKLEKDGLKIKSSQLKVGDKFQVTTEGQAIGYTHPGFGVYEAVKIESRIASFKVDRGLPIFNDLVCIDITNQYNGHNTLLPDQMVILV